MKDYTLVAGSLQSESMILKLQRILRKCILLFLFVFSILTYDSHIHFVNGVERPPRPQSKFL